MCHECDKVRSSPPYPLSPRRLSPDSLARPLQRSLPCELVKPAQMDARKAVKLGLAAPKPPRGSAPPVSSVAQQPQPDRNASRLPLESTSGLDMLARWCVQASSSSPTRRKADLAFVSHARSVDRVTETNESAEVETPGSPSFNSSPPRAVGAWGPLSLAVRRPAAHSSSFFARR
mgnify:CR=1 FL=1